MKEEKTIDYVVNLRRWPDIEFNGEPLWIAERVPDMSTVRVEDPKKYVLFPHATYNGSPVYRKNKEE